MTQKHGLGRGLSSLIPQKTSTQQTKSTNLQQKTYNNVTKHKNTKKQEIAKNNNSSSKPEIKEEIQDAVKDVAVASIRANTQQPRMYFDDDKLDELSQSIKIHGVLQPLVVVKNKDHYELIAGERRLRASKKAGLGNVPVIIKDGVEFTDQKKLELALVENIQRHDLNIIEEAKSYQRLSNDFELSQEEIAVRTGKSRSVIANRMRLLALPIEIQKSLIAGNITEGHAKVILSLPTSQKQIALHDLILTQKLTVRQAENKALSANSAHRIKQRQEQTLHARRLEEQLTKYFGTKVRVKEGASGGQITVSYFSEEELKNILSRLKMA